MDLVIKVGKSIIKLPLEDVYFVTTHLERPHYLMFVVRDGVYESPGSLNEVEVEAGNLLLRCHRKYLVNPSKIRGLDFEKRLILFREKNVSDISCSRRHFSAIRLKCLEYKE